MIDLPLLTLIKELLMVTPDALVKISPVLAVIFKLDKLMFCKILLLKPTKLPALLQPVAVNWLIEKPFTEGLSPG